MMTNVFISRRANAATKVGLHVEEPPLRAPIQAVAIRLFTLMVFLDWSIAYKVGVIAMALAFRAMSEEILRATATIIRMEFSAAVDARYLLRHDKVTPVNANTWALGLVEEQCNFVPMSTAHFAKILILQKIHVIKEGVIVVDIEPYIEPYIEPIIYFMCE